MIMNFRILFYFFISFLVVSCSETSETKSTNSKAAFSSDSFKKANSTSITNSYGGGTVANSNSKKYEKVKNENANYSSYGNYDPTKNTRNRVKEEDKKEVEISSSYSTNNTKKNYAAEAKKNVSFSAYGQN
jgi:hypothetical protein